MLLLRNKQSIVCMQLAFDEILLARFTVLTMSVINVCVSRLQPQVTEEPWSVSAAVIHHECQLLYTKAVYCL